MHWSKLLHRPKAPFPMKGNNFETLFVTPQRKKKAWDGQDKDAFFRDKYAHVHAKQKKQHEREQQLRQERLSKQLKNSPSNLTSSSSTPKPVPKPDFRQKFTERLSKKPALEYIYGTNAVKAASKVRPATKLYSGCKYEVDIDSEIVESCQSRNIHIVCNVPAQHLQIMSDQGVHNKCVLETEKRNLQKLDTSTYDDTSKLSVVNESTPDETRKAVARRQPLGLFIDQVTDTHNMGALSRSASWFGVDFVAFSSRNSAPFSPPVVKASSGAAEFISLWETTKPLKLFETLKAQDWAIVASAPNPDTIKKHGINLTNVTPKDLTSLEKPTLLVVGSEGDGIRTSLLQRSTHSTSLESSQSEIDSLNVSVATAILLNYCT